MSEMLGRILGGRYEILERLGTGGMAEVYKGRHIQLDRFVAIKIMHGFLAADSQFQQRFEREARSIAQLRHTNIIQVYDFAKEGDLFYMVMEYVDGKALDQRLRELAEQETILPRDELFTITRSIAGALEYAHNRGMIHRDIKPSNVMIDQDGRVILMDFGIARIVGGTQLTASGAMMGTPAYMPPEHGLGSSGDHRADLYSFGVMIFEMATGRLPFQAETPLAVVLSHVNDPLPLPSSVYSDIDARIEYIILRLTEKRPEDRYQTASELIADLESDQIPEMPPRSDENIAATKPPASSAPTVPGETTQSAVKPPISKSRRFIMGAGAAVIAVIAILLLVVIGSQGGSSDTPTPTTRAIAADLATSTDTPVKVDSPTPSRIATPTRTPTETPDFAATQEFLAPTLTEQAMQTAIARATELEFAERTRIAEVVGNTRAALTVESARYTAAAATLTAEAPTATPTFTPSHTLTPSHTPTSTLTPSDTPTRTLTPSNTPTYTPSDTLTTTHTPSNTPSDTPTATHTPSNTLTLTYTPSDTPTPTYTPSDTPTSTFTPSDTPTQTFTPSDTPTPTPTPTITPNLTATQAVLAPTQTRQATETLVAEATAAAAAQKTSIARIVQNTRDALSTERALNTAAAATLTAEAPTATFTYTPSDTPTSSLTPSPSQTPSRTPTLTATPTRTPDYVATQERETFVALLTQLAPTATPTPSDTLTATPTATFTPEGGGPGNIVFSADIRGEQEVFVVPVGGPPENGPAPITQNPSGDQDAAWSPDGKRIAFASDRDGDWDIYVMGTDGILLAQVTNAPGSDMMPSWSPDGQRLVFVSDRAGTLELYMTYADGRDPFSAQMLTTGGSAKTDPAWSPDGTDILYILWDEGIGTLYLIGADGSDPRSIYGGGFPSAKTSSPAWSPDGRLIAFAANLEGDDAEIYTVDEFGRLAQLTNNDVDDLRPAWSPAGDWIAFGRESVEGNAFYRVRADGTDEQVIWDGAGALSVQGMAWQPPEDALIAPTSTPIASPTPRATATPTATPTPEACTVKLTQAANIRLGPTTGWGIVTTGAVGDIFDVLGKNSFGTWWKLDLPGMDYDGWVAISLTEYDEAACAGVPIAESPRPAVQPTDPPSTEEEDENDEDNETTAETPTTVPEGEDVPIELWHEPVSCIYVGDMDYSCRVNIYINGGSPPFTMWYNNNRYSGYTPQEIIVQWRRCDIATFGVRVHDDTGLPGHDVQQGFAIDPSAYGSVFPGGSCSLP